MDQLLWTFTKFISYLILPPTPLILSLAIGVWTWNASRLGRKLAVGSVVILVLLSLPVVGNLLQRPFEFASPPLDSKAIQDLPREDSVIVILGGGTTLGAIEYPDHETLSPMSLLRSRYGVRLARSTGLPLGVSSGKSAGAKISEAKLMRNFIENEMRQPVLFSEEKSLDTRQSALYVAKRLQTLKIHSVVLVTDALHMPRAQRAFESAGLRVIPASMNFHSTAPRDVMDFLPSIFGMSLTQAAAYELLGQIWYRSRMAISNTFGVRVPL